MLSSATAARLRSLPKARASCCSRLVITSAARTVGLRLSRAKSYSVRLIQCSNRSSNKRESSADRSCLASRAVSSANAGSTSLVSRSAVVCWSCVIRTASRIDRKKVTGKNSQNFAPARDQFGWALG